MQPKKSHRNTFSCMPTRPVAIDAPMRGLERRGGKQTRHDTKQVRERNGGRDENMQGGGLRCVLRTQGLTADGKKMKGACGMNPLPPQHSTAQHTSR